MDSGRPAAIPKLPCAPVLALMSARQRSGATAYAGTAEGRLLASHDSGATWNEASRSVASAVDRIWVDGDRPDVALAAAGTHLIAR